MLIKVIAYQSVNSIESPEEAPKACLQATSWFEEFSWVFLRFVTVPKQDLKTQLADYVYGEPLQPPSQGPSRVKAHGHKTFLATLEDGAQSPDKFDLSTKKTRPKDFAAY
ncbi:hypothetical protein RRG08_022169 [Elysia crispata]|uniref:Uncharacterized protein n=1 Tax=Elysia crispata TaxID=231223 RepID=A0AAE1DYN1_9GAST|nr:hypothetical protein RRG08_022169 [Elysia crispata]